MADTPETDGPASVGRVRWHVAQKSDEAERLLAVLRRWTAFAEEHYADWPGRPRCGHYFGGSYWYMGETLATCFSLAVASSFGPWDAAEVGVDRAVVREHVVRGLRYACFTHDTGPTDCVRVQGTLHYVSGRKWGGEGESFFMASQNGG